MPRPEKNFHASPQPARWPGLQQRSLAPELMDAPDLPEAVLSQALREMDLINRHLGGHRSTLLELEHLLRGGQKRRWRLLDVGCGSGDSLRRIARWAQQRGYQLDLTGLDLQREALELARAESARLGENNIRWVQADYRDYDQPCDLVLSSLFCHHLNETELSHFIGWMRQRATYGFVLNDLHRHFLAYHSIRWLTHWFSRSELVRYDAPLSVWRAFRRQELQAAFAAHGLHPQITWHWAFRYGVRGYV